MNMGKASRSKRERHAGFRTHAATVGGAPLQIDALEFTYQLNFPHHFKDLVDFVQASWNLSSLFFHNIHVTDLDAKQKVCILCIGKSQRLLRAAYILTERGLWSEAEPMMRSQYELQLLQAYILQDKTASRAEKWISATNPKERWPVKEMQKIFENVDLDMEHLYEGLSLNPHNHILSFHPYLAFEEGKFLFQQGPLGGNENNERAKKGLSHMANTNAALCEISRDYFDIPASWEQEHIKLQQLPFYQRIATEAAGIFTQHPEQLGKIHSFIDSLYPTEKE